MSFTVTVDWDVCQDHGQCVFSAPEVFQIDASGRLAVLIGEPDEAMRSHCEEAADVCPVQAITIGR